MYKLCIQIICNNKVFIFFWKNISKNKNIVFYSQIFSKPFDIGTFFMQNKFVSMNCKYILHRLNCIGTLKSCTIIKIRPLVINNTSLKFRNVKKLSIHQSKSQ